MTLWHSVMLRGNCHRHALPRAPVSHSVPPSITLPCPHWSPEDQLAPRKPGAPQQLHRLSSPGYPPRPQQGYPSGGGPHPAAQAPMGYGTPGGAALRFNRPGQMPVRPPASASQEQALEQAHRQERVKWRECLQHIELNHSRDLTALQVGPLRSRSRWQSLGAWAKSAAVAGQGQLAAKAAKVVRRHGHV